MDNHEQYIKKRQIEEVIKKFLQPMKGIPFSNLHKGTYRIIGYRV